MAGRRNAPRRFAVPEGRVLPPDFYRRPTLRVARDLLGATLVRRTGGTILAGRIVEVEAYLGATDPASHAFRGKTARNKTMFSAGGRLYVYFTYGMHYCANVVTGRRGTGSAVLIRALEPVAGIERMARNRGLAGHRVAPRMITGGPARLCKALRIAASDDGLSLQGPEIRIVSGPPPPRGLVASSPRIGIRAGREKLWRFYVRGNACVSRP